MTTTRNDLKWLAQNIEDVYTKYEEGCLVCLNLLCAFIALHTAVKPSREILIKFNYATRLYKGLN